MGARGRHGPGAPGGGNAMHKVLWTVLMLLGGISSAEARIVDRIYAQVNDDIITVSDVNRRADLIRRELSQKLSGDALEQAMQKESGQILEDLIREKLFVQKAIELGYDAEVESHVAQHIQDIMKEYNFATMEDFEEALEKQGSTLGGFRDSTRNQIMAQQIRQSFVGSRITLMGSEVERYYKDHASDFASPEEVSLSEIVVTAKSGEGDQEAEKRARSLYDRLKRGESFASLAAGHSSGATAASGGGIGSNLLEKWHPDIVRAIAGVEAGSVSEPQKTGEGYVIYRVDTRTPSVIPPLAEIEDEIKRRLYNEKYEPELERFVQRLKDEAYIQIHPDPE